MTYGRKSFIINPMRLIALLLLFSLSADAGTVSRLYDFEPNTKAQADQVDAELDNIISTLNGNIDTENLSTGAFGTSSLANYSVTSIKLATGSVTAEKMAASSVTNSNLGTANLARSSATGAFSITSAEGEQTFVTASLTTYGRPISVAMRPDQSSATKTRYSYFTVTSSASTSYFGEIFVFLDGTLKSNTAFSQVGDVGTTNGELLPCQAMISDTFDGVAAGAHTVTASIKVDTANSRASVINCKLEIWEQ